MKDMEVQAPFLVIFDVDGTLTQSNGVDEDCFVLAVEQEFGIPAHNARLHGEEFAETLRRALEKDTPAAPPAAGEGPP